MKQLFSGGIHPEGFKELSRGGEPTPVPAPETVVIPLRQHIGSACEPLVSVGDSVLMGQKIGDGDSRSSPVHATVSGTVTASRSGKSPAATASSALHKERRQGHSRAHDRPRQLAEPERQGGRRHRPRVRHRRHGRRGLPDQLQDSLHRGKTKDVLINACECEPYITSDDTEMCCFAHDVIGGAKLLCKVLGAEKSIIAIEDNKPEAAEALKAELGDEPSVENPRPCPPRYPQGAKKQLILAVTGREVAPNARSGALFNVTTTANVYRAVTKGQPLLEKIVTVTGDGANEPKNMLVRIGTSFADVIKAAGGIKEETAQVVAGGPHDGQGRRAASTCPSSRARTRYSASPR